METRRQSRRLHGLQTVVGLLVAVSRLSGCDLLQILSGSPECVHAAETLLQDVGSDAAERQKADKPSQPLRMHASEKEITDQLELLQARAKPPPDAPPNIQDCGLVGVSQAILA